MTDATIRWVATLSDGTTAVEHSGEYQIVPGQRKPWVRLCSFLAENDLYLTSLRVDYKGRSVHLPRANFTKFGFEKSSCAPSNYSLQYLLEGTISEMGELEQEHFIDVIAHCDSFDIHYVQDLQNGDNSWVIVTDPLTTLAPTPMRKDAPSD